MSDKRTVDFNQVEEGHREIHNRLYNWAMWVMPRPGSSVHPMWRQYRSNAWQWHMPEFRQTCDTQDAIKIEKLMCHLPPTHRESLRWCYLYRISPKNACRVLHVSYDSLYRLVRDSRQMILNLAK